MKEIIFVLYVADQIRSKNFYKTVLKRTPIVDNIKITEFRLNDWTRLCLIKETTIPALLKKKLPDPAKGNGIPRCEIYMYVNEPGKYLDRAIEAGAKLICKEKMQNWGEFVAYCADFDGNILGFARVL